MSAERFPTLVPRLFALAGLAAALTACSSAPSAATSSEPVNTGLDALSAGQASHPGSDLKLVSTIDASKGPITGAEQAALVQQAIADLKAYQTRNPSAGLDTLTGAQTPTDLASIFEPAAQPPTPSDPSAAHAFAPAPVPATAPGEANPEAPADVLAQSDQAWSTVPVTPKPAPAPQMAASSPDDALVELATRMARLLREPAPGGEKLADPVALAAIESVKPGVLADIESPSNALGPRLDPADLRALLDARERTLANPTQANLTLVKSLSRIAPPASLHIARSALCRRVDGFGRYDPFPSDTFVAGRPLRLIVYTELEGFATRPAAAADPVQPGVPLGEQLSVELSQAITLFHDPSGLQAWHKPAQRVVETTRATRRDFYLIHQIELPATLTIGRYILKVTVTDKTTGATDESAVPINIVAAAAPRSVR